MNREERNIKQTEQRISLHQLVFRALLSMLMITIIGTVTVFATRTHSQWGTLITLGLYSIFVLIVVSLAYFSYIHQEIKKL